MTTKGRVGLSPAMTVRSVAGTITVEDPTTTVSNVSTIDFTSGAVVSNLGAGVAGVAITGGGGTSSARIFQGGALTQLSGGGYAFTGVSGHEHWDDASYWQTYGARAGGEFDSSAIVAIAPVAGRYRFHAAVLMGFTSPAIDNSFPQIYLVWEYDSTGAENDSTTTYLAASTPSNGHQVWGEVTYEAAMAVGGCIGFASIFSSSPPHDQVIEGYWYVEKIG